MIAALALAVALAGPGDLVQGTAGPFTVLAPAEDGRADRYVVVVEVDPGDPALGRVNVWDLTTDRLALRAHASTGIAGVGKAGAGDGRTPLGAYRVVEHRVTPPDGDLRRARVGDHAFLLDYPRAGDPGGGGILLHGADHLRTAGCVATDADLTPFVEAGTSVFIGERVLGFHLATVADPAERRRFSDALRAARWIEQAHGPHDEALRLLRDANPR